jgi:hypothetical protein
VNDFSAPQLRQVRRVTSTHLHPDLHPPPPTSAFLLERVEVASPTRSMPNALNTLFFHARSEPEPFPLILKARFLFSPSFLHTTTLLLLLHLICPPPPLIRMHSRQTRQPDMQRLATKSSPSGIRSAVRASSILPNSENALWRPERVGGRQKRNIRMTSLSYCPHGTSASDSSPYVVPG